MATPKKKGKQAMKKRGRPNKHGKVDYKDFFTTITIQRSIRNRLKKFKDDRESGVDDTLSAMMDVTEKIGDSYLGLGNNPTAQRVLDGIAKAERMGEKEKEDGK